MDPTEGGRHLEPGDTSFVTSVLQHLGAGVALIAVVAAAFWGIGKVGVQDPGDPVITDPSPSDAPSSPAVAVPPSDAPTSPAPSDPTPTDASPSATASPTPTASATAATDIDPAEITIQVLDAGADDEAFDQLVAQLRDDGYRVVATNRASRTYERSVVFFTDGHEAEARQISTNYRSLSQVQPKPDNLSDSVHVHIVVGTDY